MTTDEVWREIPGMSGYEVSDQGRVRSVDRTIKGIPYQGKLLAAHVDDGGYLNVDIRHGRSRGQRVHRLLALAYIGEPPFPGAVVRHLNDVKLDNRLSNLAWGSKSDNALDAVKNGTHSAAGSIKSHCVRGHELQGAHVRVDPNSDSRICKPCARVWGVFRHYEKQGRDTSVFGAFRKGTRMRTVRVYTKPNCGPCGATKRLFTSLGVPYVEEDATEPANVAALKFLGYLSAPVVVAGESNDDMWSGFQPDRIKALAERVRSEA